MADGRTFGVFVFRASAMPQEPESAGVKLSAREPFTLASPNRLFYDRRMIRQAIASDAVKAVPLIMQAIGDIAIVLTGATDGQEAASVLNDFFGKEDNRISYQNALVMEEKGEVVGVAIFYDGRQSPRAGCTTGTRCRQELR
jgi:hypothetical protein